MHQLTLRINEVMRDLFSNAGFILVNVKLECGVFAGKLYLGDEISPDSCRAGVAQTHGSLHISAALKEYSQSNYLKQFGGNLSWSDYNTLLVSADATQAHESMQVKGEASPLFLAVASALKVHQIRSLDTSSNLKHRTPSQTQITAVDMQ